MKYTEITTNEQYQNYSERHLEIGNVLRSAEGNSELENEYYVLDLIIQDYNRKQNNPFKNLTPVDLLKSLMTEYGYSGYKLHKELGISQSVISDILNYKRGFSKDMIRKLSNKFKIDKEAFFKEYELIGKK